MDSRKILEIYKRINDRSIKPVSAWASISDIPPGMLVLGADGVVKKKVGVGNFVNNNSTTIQDTITCSFGFATDVDYDISIVSKIEPGTEVGFFGLFCSGTAAATGRGVWIERAGTQNYFTASLYDSSGFSQSIGGSSITIDNAFHKIRVKKVSRNIFFSVDDVVKNVSEQTLTVNSFSQIRIGSQAASRSITGQIALVRLVHSDSSQSFCYDFSEGVGNTLVDKCGNGRNGTITDVSPTNFWSTALVPVSML